MSRARKQVYGSPASKWNINISKGRDTLLAYSLAFYNDFKLFIVLKQISTMLNDRSAHSAGAS